MAVLWRNLSITIYYLNHSTQCSRTLDQCLTYNQIFNEPFQIRNSEFWYHKYLNPEKYLDGLTKCSTFVPAFEGEEGVMSPLGDSLIFKFLSEIYDHSFCETKEPRTQVWQFKGALKIFMSYDNLLWKGVFKEPHWRNCCAIFFSWLSFRATVVEYAMNVISMHNIYLSTSIKN